MDYLKTNGIEIIDITFEESASCVANYIQVAPRKLVGYDGNLRVEKEIEKRGGTVITFPGTELFKGKGGPHCMTVCRQRNSDTIGLRVKVKFWGLGVSGTPRGS